MYNNLHYMFGGSNSYIDYYFGNNYVLQQENDLLRKEIKKEKNNYTIIQEYILNLEDKLELLTNDYDELKFKYEMLKNNNDIIEDFEKI